MDRSLPIPRKRGMSDAFRVSDMLPAFRELYRRHELLWHMTVRHLRGQYKQSVLGYAWAFVNPFAFMLTLTFVFSTILRFESPGVPYALFVMVGIIPWIFFSTSVSAATESVTGASSLVTKVYFPREILPMAAVFTKVVDLFFGLLILMGMMVYFGHAPTETVAWVPVLFVIHLLFIMGFSFPLAALNLYFHDVRFLVGVVLTLWFYLTPVIYPIDIVPERYGIIFDLNPNSLLINAYRRVVLMDTSPHLDSLLMGIVISGLTFLVGYYLFKKMERDFADSM